MKLLSADNLLSQISLRQKLIFYFLVLLLSISMLVSPFATGLLYFLMGFLWIFFASHRSFLFFKDKIKQKLFHPTRYRLGVNSWIVVLFIVHFVALLWTSDFNFAFNDLRIKSAWILFPLVFFAFEGINYKQWKFLLWIFTATIGVVFLFSLSKYWKNPNLDHREYSIFISHIRFSLMLTATLYFHAIEFFKQKKRCLKILHLISMAFLFFYLLFLSSLSGVFISIFLIPVFLNYQLKKQKYTIIISVVLLIIPFLYLAKVAKDFFPKVSFSQQCNEYNLRGDENLYLRSHAVENGNFVGLNLEMTNLKSAWNSKYEAKYHLRGLKNFYSLLVRYLTSKSLPKNAEGLAKLDKQDFVNLKNGIPNAIFIHKTALYIRIYNLIWEIYHYYYGANPSGHTFTQRLEFWKSGWSIFRQNFWVGVGEGDIKNSFIKQYEIDKSKLFPEFRFRTHNQFLSFYISFGIIGGTLCLLALFIPYYFKGRKNIYFTILFIIMLLSMLTEDTFENQAGSTFFAFFYSLFLFSPKWSS